jgi:hypothetical protein
MLIQDRHKDMRKSYKAMYNRQKIKTKPVERKCSYNTMYKRQDKQTELGEEERAKTETKADSRPKPTKDEEKELSDNTI